MQVLVQSESGSFLSLFLRGQPWKHKSDLFLKSVVLTVLLLTLLFPWRERDKHLHLPLPLPGRCKFSGWELLCLAMRRGCQLCMRVMEQLCLEWTSGHHLVQLPCSEQGHLEKVVQNFVQLGFEYFQRLNNLSGQPFPMFGHSQGKTTVTLVKTSFLAHCLFSFLWMPLRRLS